jgi:hypothetical protein
MLRNPRPVFGNDDNGASVGREHPMGRFEKCQEQPSFRERVHG